MYMCFKFAMLEISWWLRAIYINKHEYIYLWKCGIAISTSIQTM